MRQSSKMRRLMEIMRKRKIKKPQNPTELKKTPNIKINKPKKTEVEIKEKTAKTKNSIWKRIIKKN